MGPMLSSIVWMLVGGAIGAVITFIVTKKMFEKQVRENPPINEKMIRAMYMQMGRKPSEKQIREIMRSMGQ